MKVEQILSIMEDPEALKVFLRDSKTAVTHNMNQSRVAAEIILARTILRSTASFHTDFDQMSQRIEKALKDHSATLNKSADAANKHARGMKRATVVLAIFTIFLFFSTFAYTVITYKAFKGSQNQIEALNTQAEALKGQTKVLSGLINAISELPKNLIKLQRDIQAQKKYSERLKKIPSAQKKTMGGRQ